MSAQSPSAPSQPPASAAYTALRNPITRKPSEQAVADTPSTSGPYGSGNDYMEYRSSSNASEQQPSKEQPQPQPQARGIRGVDPRDYRQQQQQQQQHPLRQNENVDAQEQMAPEAEGDVARAVTEQSRRRKSLSDWHGRARGEVTLEGMEAGMERKRAQQMGKREEVERERREGRVEGVEGRVGIEGGEEAG